ncbi:MAG: ATP-binding protein [Atopobiaceae bacterium]|jgi:ATP-dependent DNA helicase RecG|nr:putative DNA binding domain-containing protein [Atopobiaceae bacterium]MDD3176095.1 ATP-binding protein [Atopobiaceae bacterium]MDD4380787.1 ATP-binding protein [Atopobiaceae bacterium]
MNADRGQSYLDRTIGRLRLFGTDLQEIEVKESVNHLPKSMGETLSAFANGTGGDVLLGVSERDGFSPAPHFQANRIQDALSNLCAEGMEPPLRPMITLAELGGAPVVMARVAELPPRDKPCYVKKRGLRQGSFIRTGDGDRHMTDYEIDRLLEEHEQPQHDAELVGDASVDDLDDALVAGLIARERAVHPRVSGSLADEVILQNLRALAPDEDAVLRPTIAGLLALGRYPQKYYPRLAVTFASFPGRTKSDGGGVPSLLDSETLVGPIPALVADTLGAVRRNMRTGGLIDGAFRKDLPDYPLVAVREAVTNALMHRDYSAVARGMQVQVNMYEDRLEITNPGGLYGTLTLDMLGAPGFSATRNQHLSLLLEETPYPDGGFVAENRGTGYQRIVSELAENLMPSPVAKSTASYFSLTFEKRRLSKEEHGTLPAGGMEKAILAAVEESGSVSARELMEMSGLSRGGVMRYVNRLVDGGILEHMYPGRSPKQRYRLKR